jgi:hypothetical protein
MLLPQPFELRLQLDLFVFDHWQPPKFPTPFIPRAMSLPEQRLAFPRPHRPRSAGVPPALASPGGEYHNGSKNAA